MRVLVQTIQVMLPISAAYFIFIFYINILYNILKQLSIFHHALSNNNNVVLMPKFKTMTIYHAIMTFLYHFDMTLNLLITYLILQCDYISEL